MRFPWLVYYLFAKCTGKTLSLPILTAQFSHTVQINDLSLILIEFNQYLIYLKLRVGNEIGYSQVYSYNKIIIYS